MESLILFTGAAFVALQGASRAWHACRGRTIARGSYGAQGVTLAGSAFNAGKPGILTAS
jgi:hypothetical protein